MTVYTYHTDGAAFFRRPVTTMTAREYSSKTAFDPAECPVSFGSMLASFELARVAIATIDNVVERRPRRLQERR